jgi:hypothetical protein
MLPTLVDPEVIAAVCLRVAGWQVSFERTRAATAADPQERRQVGATRPRRPRSLRRRLPRRRSFFARNSARQARGSRTASATDNGRWLRSRNHYVREPSKNYIRKLGDRDTRDRERPSCLRGPQERARASKRLGSDHAIRAAKADCWPVEHHRALHSGWWRDPLGSVRVL